jgi:hypothetical protein
MLHQRSVITVHQRTHTHLLERLWAQFVPVLGTTGSAERTAIRKIPCTQIAHGLHRGQHMGQSIQQEHHGDTE